MVRETRGRGGQGWGLPSSQGLRSVPFRGVDRGLHLPSPQLPLVLRPLSRSSPLPRTPGVTAPVGPPIPFRSPPATEETLPLATGTEDVTNTVYTDVEEEETSGKDRPCQRRSPASQYPEQNSSDV